MNKPPPNFNILLIDEKASGLNAIQNILNALTDAPFQIDHVQKCSQAFGLLRDRSYALVLLEKQLSLRISAKFSVPIIKAAIKQAPIAIISDEASAFNLLNPADLGVDYIVNTPDIIDFLKSQMDYLLGRVSRPLKDTKPAFQ